MADLFDMELAVRLGTALAIGLVVGVERGWRERTAPAGSRTAGVRTYALSGLLGGVFGAVSSSLQSPWLVGLGFLGFSFAFAVFKLREAIHDDDFSVTGVVAAFAVFIIGAYAVVGSIQIAAGAGAALAVVLASREFLHGLLARLSWAELRSALMILGMSAIVLPLLPNHAIDPFGGINLHEIWLFAILAASISYIGYLAIRIFPPQHGIVVAAVTGALISSTAVTMDLARRSRKADAISGLAGGACLAGAVFILRVLTLVAVLRPSLLVPLAPGCLAAALVFGIIGAALMWRSARDEDAAIAPGNPFDIPTILAFATVFALVAFTAAFLLEQFGARGLFATVLIAAIADVDAASLAVLRLAGANVPTATTVSAIFLAIAVNALTKCVYAIALGSHHFALLFCGATVAALSLGLAAHLLIEL